MKDPVHRWQKQAIRLKTGPRTRRTSIPAAAIPVTGVGAMGTDTSQQGTIMFVSMMGWS